MPVPEQHSTHSSWLYQSCHAKADAHQSSGRPRLGKVAAGSTPWWLRLWIANTHRASCTNYEVKSLHTSYAFRCLIALVGPWWLMLWIANTHRASCMRRG